MRGGPCVERAERGSFNTAPHYNVLAPKESYFFSFCTNQCLVQDRRLVVSVPDMYHIYQICDVMYGAGEEMKPLSFHPQMQLSHDGWAVLINIAG